MDKQNRRSSGKIGIGGILIRAALILLCLVLLSVYLMDGLYARYKTSGDGADSARVAKFDVDVKFKDGENRVDFVTAKLAYDQATGTYTIVVDNNSEVAICYDIYIENIQVLVSVDDKTPTNMLNGVSVQLDGGSEVFITGDNVAFVDAGTMAPNASADNQHALHFLVDWNAFLQNISGRSVSATIDFDVRVDIEQID